MTEKDITTTQAATAIDFVIFLMLFLNIGRNTTLELSSLFISCFVYSYNAILQIAVIDFHSVIHEDIDRIADDLRILHKENKKDTQVALDDTCGLSILIDIVQKLKDFKGTPQEMKLKLFTPILGTDINKLNNQEKSTILKLIKKGEMTHRTAG